MLNFQSGVLDKTRLVSNVLMLILLAGNIFFSIQYWSGVQAEKNAITDNGQTRIQIARFLKYYIDTVLTTQGTISFEDRVKLENDIRQIHDPELTAQWELFVSSQSEAEAQTSAVKLMSLLTNKML